MAKSYPLKAWWRTWRCRIAFRRFCRSHPLGCDEVGVVMQHGVGDHVLVAGFAAAISRHYGAHVVLAGRAGMKFVADLFPSVSRYAELPAACVGREVGATTIACGVWTFGHFRGMELARVIGYKSMGLLDAYRCLFGLDSNAQLERPCLPDETQRLAADDFLRKSGYVPGRTIFFSRYARSTPVSKDSQLFFSEAVHRFSVRGYAIIDNEDDQVPRAARPEIPLPQMRSIVASAGGFVSVRNGLCDLLCDLPVNGAIIYADARYLGGRLIAGTSVADYGFGQNVTEHVVGTGTDGDPVMTAENVVARFPVLEAAQESNELRRV